MYLVDAIFGLRIFQLPSYFNGRIAVSTTCRFTPMESMAIEKAFSMTAEVAKTDMVPIRQIEGLNAIFVKEDSFSFVIDSNHCGNEVRFVLYPVHRWREKNYNDIQIMTCVVEELAHAIWLIHDEDAVKNKVVEIFRTVYPNISKNDLYNL